MNTPVKSDSTMKDVCLFALPMLIGNVLQSCYSMVDMAVVGQYVGRDGLAAVSNTAMLCFIGNSLCFGFSIGGNVLVARYRGAGSAADQRATIRTLLVIAAAGGLILTALFYALYRPALAMMNIPAEVLPHAVTYMAVVSAGNFFVFGYNAACAVMRGLGDSVRPVHVVAIAAVVNVALDFLFVGAFGWGVGGAAFATVLAQAVSCVAAIGSLARMNVGGESAVSRPPEAEPAPWFSRDKAAELLRMGLPLALHSAVLNITYTVVTALFNDYGTAAAAAAGIGIKVNTFIAMPCWAIGQAVATMAGFHMGARDPDTAGRVAAAGIQSSLLFTGSLLVGLHLFLRPFLGLFTPDAEVVALGVLYLRICCSVNFLPYAVMYVLDNFALGVGRPVLAMANSLMQSVVARLGLSIVLTAWVDWGFTGLCAAEAVSPVVPCIIILVFFYRGAWRG